MNALTRKSQHFLYQSLGPLAYDDLNIAISKIQELAYTSITGDRTNSVIMPSSISRIRVICQKADGLGDVVFAYKVAKIFKEHFPNLEVTLQGINEDSQNSLTNYVEQNPLQDVLLAPGQFTPDQITESESENTLIIHGPVLTRPLDLPKHFPKHQRLDIGEYSSETYTASENKPFINSGLGDEELGIFCPVATEKTEEPTKWQNSLLNRILGQEPLSSEFYVGYASEASVLANYAVLACCAESAFSQNIDICCPGYRLLENPIALIDFLQETFSGLLKQNLRNLNVQILLPTSALDALKKIVYVTPFFQYLHMQRSDQGGISMLSCHLSDSTTKTLRILLPGTVPEQDVANLQKESKDHIPLITGDQSFSKSLGKLFMYEVRSHKSQFFRNLIDLCQKHHLNELAEFFIVSKNYLRYEGENPTRLIEMWSNPVLKEQALELRKIIEQNHNISNKIIAKAIEKVSSAF